MGIDEFPSIEQTPLSAENIIRALPFACKKGNGENKSEQSIRNIEISLNLMMKHGLLDNAFLQNQLFY
jgi:hypothetical protein